MPNFKEDKSKFTMKNMNYYKGKFAEGEASSPYNKNKTDGHEAMHKTFTEGFIPNKDLKIRKDLIEGFIPNEDLKLRKDLREGFIPNTEYTPQTESRKDISTDITPQTQKGKKFLKSKITKLIKKKK